MLSDASGRAAYFDVDNTLLDTKSMFSFQAFYLDCWLPLHGRSRESFAEFKGRLDGHPRGGDRMVLNRAFYEGYAGLVAMDVAEAAKAWFESLSRTRGDALWILGAVDLARVLKAQGHVLVAVSGSTQAILQPVLDALGFEHCLATRLETQDGVYTGRILGTQMIGPGKGIAVRAFAVRHGIDLASSTAVGDHITDLSMLDCVGHPRVVAGDREMEALALHRGWPLIQAPSSDQLQAFAHV